MFIIQTLKLTYRPLEVQRKLDDVATFSRRSDVLSKCALMTRIYIQLIMFQTNSKFCCTDTSTPSRGSSEAITAMAPVIFVELVCKTFESQLKNSLTFSSDLL